MKILITGVAGFIGFHLSKNLLDSHNEVIGIDNINDYYDTELKKSRIEELKKHKNSERFHFFYGDIADFNFINDVTKDSHFDVFIHLAAQAGVRYSIDNPSEYTHSNLVGFSNVLEVCRKFRAKHLIFASSSSVYGMNTSQPFRTNDSTDFPVSFYAATKKANEVMAYSYSHLYDIPITGLRFFTVYGPYGRPDMAYFKFTKSILDNEPINVYNNGLMKRDFTYIDDITEAIKLIIYKIPSRIQNKHTKSNPNFKIYNIGNNKPVTLDLFINAIEKACGKHAIKNNLPMQAGDVPITYAEISDLQNDFNFEPKTTIEDGMYSFVDWYKSYYLNTK